MPSVSVVGADGKGVGSVSLADALWKSEGRSFEVYEAVKNLRANRRAGTHATKTRSDVSGGGKKPWRQKGTGRARAGSVRSPLWKGGATLHGPHPRDYAYAIPRKVRREAFRRVLADKLQAGRLLVIDALTLPQPKTREAAALLARVGADGATLVLLARPDAAFERAARNLARVEVRNVAEVDTYEVLKARSVVVPREAVGALEGRMGSKVKGAEGAA